MFLIIYIFLVSSKLETCEKDEYEELNHGQKLIKISLSEFYCRIFELKDFIVYFRMLMKLLKRMYTERIRMAQEQVGFVDHPLVFSCIS